MTVTYWKWLHSSWLRASGGEAGHPIGAGCGTLLHPQIWKTPCETTVVAVFGAKPFNLFPALLPVQCPAPRKFGVAPLFKPRRLKRQVAEPLFYSRQAARTHPSRREVVAVSTGRFGE